MILRMQTNSCMNSLHNLYRMILRMLKDRMQSCAEGLANPGGFWTLLTSRWHRAFRRGARNLVFFIAFSRFFSHAKKRMNFCMPFFRFFARFWRFPAAPTSILMDFGSQNRSPEAAFVRFFSERGFWSFFGHFFRKNARRRKMKKWLSYCKNHTIVRVAISKKARAAWGNCVRKNIDFSLEIDPKSGGKSWKTARAAKISKHAVLGAPF